VGDKRLNAFIDIEAVVKGRAAVDELSKSIRSLNVALRRSRTYSGNAQQVKVINDEAKAHRAVSKEVKERFAHEKKFRREEAALAKTQIAQAKAVAKASRDLINQQKAVHTAWKSNLYNLRATSLDMSYIMGNAARQSGMALGAIGLAVGGLSKTMISARARMESYQEQMTALTGSAELGKKALQQITTFAMQSPLTFEETIKSVEQLKAAYVGLNDVFKNDNEMLKVLTNMAAFKGKPMDQVTSSLLAIRRGNWQSRAMGSIGITKDFLAEIGIGWDSSKGIGRPKGLTAETGPAYFEKIIRNAPRFIKDFKPEELLKTKLSNIEDVWFVFMNALGAKFDGISKPFLGKLQEIMRKAVDILGAPEVSKAIENIADKLIGPAFTKALNIIEGMMDKIAKDPEVITRAFKTITEAVKDLLAAFVAFTAAQGVASFMQVIGTVALAFGGGGTGSGIAASVVAIIAILGTLATTFLLTKGKLNEFTGDSKIAKDVLGGLKLVIEALSDAWETAAKQVGDFDKSLTKLTGSGILDTLATAFRNIATGIALMVHFMDRWNQMGFLGKAGMAVPGPWTPFIVGKLGEGALTDTGVDIVSQTLSGMGFGNPPGSKRSIWTGPGKRKIWTGAGNKTDFPTGNAAGGGTDATAGDEAAKKAAEEAAKYRKEIVGQSLGLIGGKQDIARSLASRALHRTDKLCAATLGEYMKMMGFNVPQFTTTKSVMDWLKTGEGSKITAGDIQPGDIIFSQDNNRNGMPDHVGIATARSGKLVTFQDQHGTRTEGLNYFSQGYRLDKFGASQAAAQSITPGMESLVALLAFVQGQQDKLSLYRGKLSPAAYAAMVKENRGAAASEYEKLALSPEFGEVSKNAPEAVDQLRRAFGADIASKALGEFTDALDKATSRFDSMVEALDNLRSAARGLQDAYMSMRGARAGAMGFTKEAEGWQIDQAALGMERGREDLATAKQVYLARRSAVGAGPQTAASRMMAESLRVDYDVQRQGIIGGIYNSIENLYNMAAGYKEKNPDLAKAAMTRADIGYKEFGPLFAQEVRTGADALTAAGDRLSSAAGMLMAAAAAQAGAVSAAASAAAAAQAPLGAQAYEGATNTFKGIGGAGAGIMQRMQAGEAGTGTASIAAGNASKLRRVIYGSASWNSIMAGTGGACGPGGCGSAAQQFAGQAMPEEADGTDKAQEAGKEAGDNVLSNFIEGLTSAAEAAGEAIVSGDWESAKQAIGNAISGALKSIITGAFSGMGPIGGVLGGLFSGIIGGLTKKLFGGGGKAQDVRRIIEPVSVKPEHLSVALGANPASSIYGGRSTVGGAGFTVQVSYRDGTEDLVAAKVASSALWEGGLRGALRGI